MRRSRPSLMRRAIAFFLFTIIASTIMGGYLLNYYTEQFLQDISKRNTDLAHLAKEHVKVFLDHHVAELSELKFLIDEHGLGEAKVDQDELDHISLFHPLLETVQVLDSNGLVVQVSSSSKDYINLDMSGHKSFLGAIDLKGYDVYWSDSFISPQTKDPAVTISMSLNNGVLLALLNLKELSRNVTSSLAEESVTIVITDRRGVVIAHPEEYMVNRSVNLLNHPSIRHAMEGRPGTYEETWEKERGLSSVTVIEDSGWVVGVFQEERMALGVVYHARRVVVIAFVLLLGLTMLAFLILLHQGMKPIKRLEEMADMIAAGQYGGDLDANFLELSGFVDSFNKMTRVIRRREHELRAGEERFRVLFDEAAEPVFLMDGRGDLLMANKRACRSLGYSPLEFAQMNVSHFIVGQDRGTVSSRLNAITGDEPTTAEGEHQRKDGTVFPVEVRIARMESDGEDRFIVHARDITLRKKTEEALRKSEEKYRLLAENAIDVMWNIDLDLRYQYVSPSITHFRGITVEEALSQNLGDGMTPDSASMVKEILQEEMEKEKSPDSDPGRSRTIEVKFKHTNGSLVWGEVTCAFLRDQDGEIIGIQGVTRDISERKRAEDALRESEERLQKISEGALEGIVISEGGVIVEANPQIHEMLGYSLGELVGKSIPDEIVAPEDRELVKQRMMKEHGETYRHDIVKKDGSRRTVEVRGRHARYRGSNVRLASIRDITDQKRAESVLMEREKRYRPLYENNPLAYQLLSEEGIYLEVNSSWEKLLGYTREEIIGKNAMDLVDPEYLEVVERSFPKLIRTGEANVPDIKLIKKDGTSVHISLHGRTSVDEETNQLRAHCLLNDLTERTRMEAALKKGAQLAAVGQVASGIAHEINNPLATISASTEALLARLPALRKDVGRQDTTVNTLNLFQEYLTMIMDEVHRSSQIIRDLLDFSRIREYVFTETDIKEMVSNIVHLLSIQSRMAKHIFMMNVSPDLPHIQADRDRLRQVLVIFLTNAVESMPDGGEINIYCGVDMKQEVVSISITDAGSGICEESLERIFEPFFTTKEFGGGTGLGLSIADNIVTKHDGRIEVKVNRGQGMTFTIILPVTRPSTEYCNGVEIH